jgi:hypothetical protein
MSVAARSSRRFRFSGFAVRGEAAAGEVLGRGRAGAGLVGRVLARGCARFAADRAAAFFAAARLRARFFHAFLRKRHTFFSIGTPMALLLPNYGVMVF